MARCLGVTQATVSRWENGRMAPSGPALKLMQLLAQGTDWPEGITRPVVDGDVSCDDGGEGQEGKG